MSLAINAKFVKQSQLHMPHGRQGEGQSTRTRPAGHFTHVTQRGGLEMQQDVHTFCIVLHPWVIAHFICILCIACNFICHADPPPQPPASLPTPPHPLLGIVRIPVRCTALTIGHSEISHLNALLLLLVFISNNYSERMADNLLLLLLLLL